MLKDFQINVISYCNPFILYHFTIEIHIVTLKKKKKTCSKVAKSISNSYSPYCSVGYQCAFKGHTSDSTTYPGAEIKQSPLQFEM